MTDLPRFCRKWISADLNRHGAHHLVCTLAWAHGGRWHYNRTHDWYWETWHWPGMATKDYATPVRDWTCLGVLGIGLICAKTIRSTEDEARVKGWKIGHRENRRDPLCPACANPDAATAKLLRELARSVR